MILDIFLFTAQILLALMVVFMVHEAGHLLMARLFRINVAEINLGFGRRLWSKTDRHGTRWSVRIFPFSGFVQLSDKERGVDEFSRAPLWRRACIVAAGPLTNFAFAFALLAVFYYLLGLPSSPPRITGILSGSAAERSGLALGDRIINIDGVPIQRFEDIGRFIDNRPNLPLVMTVRRKNGQEDIKILPDWVPDKEKKGQYKNRIGILGIHKPLAFFVVRAVNGQDVKEADARRLLLPLRGQNVRMTVEILGDEPREYLFNIPVAINSEMTNPFSLDAQRIYISEDTGYLYIRRAFARASLDAIKTGVDLVKGTTRALVHPFAERKEKMRLDVPVGSDLRFLLPWIHSFVYCAAFLSILIGFVNMLIFPGLDGYMLLRYATEMWVGQDRASLYYRQVWFATLCFLAAVIGILNMEIGGSG